jgi:hypothetical protein
MLAQFQRAQGAVDVEVDDVQKLVERFNRGLLRLVFSDIFLPEGVELIDLFELSLSGHDDDEL